MLSLERTYRQMASTECLTYSFANENEDETQLILGKDDRLVKIDEGMLLSLRPLL